VGWEKIEGVKSGGSNPLLGILRAAPDKRYKKTKKKVSGGEKH